MPPKSTDTNEAPVNSENLGSLESEAKAAEEAAKATALAEQEAAKLQAEEDEKAAADKLKVDAEEAARQAEEEKPIDMSLDARMARAKDALAEAIDAQNQINRIVAEKTKELDELIIEQAGTPDKNPMTEIQFYLTSQQRKRERIAEQRKQETAHGIDAAELIRKLDSRAPIDKRPPLRKVHPAAKTAKTAAIA